MQIKPDKHFSINNSVLSLSTILIRELVKTRNIKVDKLFEIFKNEYEDGTYDEYIYCLMFLFSLGKIEYYKNNDVIGLRNDEVK